MRKVFSFLLTLVVCGSLCVPAFATGTENNHLIYESGEISEATVEEVDALLRERNRAILAGDESAAEAIMDELYSMGVRPSTAEEIAAVSDSDIMVAAGGNYELNTIEYSTYVNGKTYYVKRIDCAVFPGCNLYQTMNISPRTIEASCQAASFDMCTAVGTTIAGVANPVAGAVLTVYDVLKNAVANLTPTTIVEDISASYDVTILEQCSFYSYKLNNYWTPYAVTQFVELEVDATIFGLDYNGSGFSHINNQDATYFATIYAGSQNDYTAGAQLREYFTSYLCNYDSMVTALILRDVNGDTLLSRGLVCPHNTSQIF